MYQVVDKPTPLPGDMISINSFGVGGTNVHVILKAHNKKVQAVSLPKVEIPRLVFLSGRTREGLEEQFEIVSFISCCLIKNMYEKSKKYILLLDRKLR